MGWFSRFWSRVTDRWIWDTPSIPWSLGTLSRDSLLNEFHTHPLGKLLEVGHPYLHDQFYANVVTPAHCMRQQQEDLAELKKGQEALAAEVGALREAIDSMPQIPTEPDMKSVGLDLPAKPVSEPWELWLTVGLSLMLFIGMAEFLGLDIQGLTLDQSPLLLLGLSGAVCINLAEYFGIFRLVKAVRRYDPQRSFQDDQRFANVVPFWQRVSTGDAAVWTSIAIVLLETMFAAPGLIGLLPPKVAAQPLFQVTVFAAAGLAAMVNIIIAWGNALGEIQWEQDVLRLKKWQQDQLSLHQQDADRYQRWERYCQRQEERERETQALRKDFGAANARLSAKDREIVKQEQAIILLTEQARCEYERWELAVRRWMRENPQVVQRFMELAPTWERKDSLNGHRPQGIHDAKRLNAVPEDL